MLSLRQHFQRIKEIVDWSWTLAILCMVGYITLGQLAQLYWAMVVFGGIAGSFGLFYEFSCEKLADLNAIEDTYKLKKVIATSDLAQDLLGKFAHRNPDIKNQFPTFDQLRYQVRNVRSTAAKLKQRVNQQTKTSSQSSTQPQSQKPTQPTPPYAPPKREAQPPLKKVTQPQPQKPTQPTPPYTPPRREVQPPLKKTTQPKITPEEYRRILNKSDYVPVKAHLRNGHPVRKYYRRKPKK